MDNKVCVKHNTLNCKKCSNTIKVSECRRNTKRKIVELFGGRCRVCGYDRYIGGLEFHHTDPTQKDFSLSAKGTTRSLEKLYIEASKCVLVCALCHREIEAGIIPCPPVISPKPFPQKDEGVIKITEEGIYVVPKSKHVCLDCGTIISKQGRCRACFLKTKKHKIEWPDTQTLLQLTQQYPMTTVGRMLGVSDNAVRKHLRKARGQD